MLAHPYARIVELMEARASRMRRMEQRMQRTEPGQGEQTDDDLSAFGIGRARGGE